MERDRPEEEATLAGLDKIFIRDLLLRCVIGINPEERLNKQDVLINLVLYVDLSKPAASDSIEDTVNYKTIKDGIIELVESSSFLLVERLVGRIAELCLEAPLVQAVRVSVEKPGALRFARSVGVELFRRRGE